MADDRPALVLVREQVETCRSRLERQGFAAEHAAQIASYLAQSTDIVADLAAIADECARRGLRFLPLDLDDAAPALAGLDPSRTLVWTLTDGIAYFRGSAGPMLARLAGLPRFGADDAAFALCQDKFRAGAVMRALGLPVPPAGLARDGRWLAGAPRSARGWFVKPNRLGAKIGIWPDSHCSSLDAALALSRRIFACYRDDAIVQAYVPGRNARASFLAVEPGATIGAAGIDLVDSGGDFQTMAESLALYGESGRAAREAGQGGEPVLEPLEASQPAATRAIRMLASRLTEALGIADVFSVDFRVEADGRVHLLEFEVCPGLPCFDFRAYCRRQWGRTLAGAMAETAARRLLAVQPTSDMQTGV